ncbi:MAG: MoaD/ThiS family protein [Phycisphaerales bacterium]
MPTLRFTANLARHVECPEGSVDGGTVQESLNSYFEQFPSVRSYVLDDRGCVRQHMVIFLNGTQIRDRAGLSDIVSPDDVIDVMQALSGG